MARSEYRGKRGANAGDDYHELWAVRRALELIVPGSDVVALSVEGVSADDAAGVDDALWDGVDAACYHGPNAETIVAVDLVQLKYSGSSPETPWTVSRLAHATNQQKTNAVVNRLATAWQAMRKQRPDLDAANKIRVKLVSNQPTAKDVSDAISAAPSDPECVKLCKASGLTQKDFDAFVTALDLSECGDQSRFVHEERVIKALSALKDGDVRAELTQLREYMRKRMRPEGKGELITAESIFGLFGHASARAFFPCPTRVAPVGRLIQRDAAERIRDRFVAGVAKMCLTGGAGEGKTTVLQDLATRLPPESELIVYDCYGEGTYLNADGYRHRAEDAFLQLGNDAAARLLLPPAFAERGIDHPRRFATKLAAASDALAARDPGALLVIAVDAADNAITAARRCVPPEHAFVRDFARLGDLRPNVRLLLTARQGRLPDLDLPDDVELVLLDPFTPVESRLFAQDRLGPQDDTWYDEFHTHSGGNPRVQRYAIEFAAGVPEHALDYLRPSGKNLTAIFAARMSEAKVRSGAPADLADLCAALVLLPRPVPIDHLAGAIAIDLDHTRDLVLDLGPGLVLDGDRVGFADEDFEHFAGEVGKTARSRVVEAAANRLFMLRAKDTYAAAHVASLALLAGHRTTVIDLVREPVRGYPLTDPAARGEVHRRRLRAAMHVCRETGSTIDATALLLEGAYAIKTDAAVNSTLLDHVELAAHFSQDRTIGLLLGNRKRRPRHGALLLQLAGINGIEGDRVGLNAHVRSFMAWQEARQAAIDEEETRRAAEGAPDDPNNDSGEGGGDVQPIPRASRRRRRETGHQIDRWVNEEAQRWPLDADDLAAMLVGRLHADGPNAVAALVGRPRPARFRYLVLKRLVRRLVLRGELSALAALADALPRHHPGRPIIALALGIAGESVDAPAMLARIERARKAGAFAARRFASDYMADDSESEEARLLLDACDLVAIHGGNRAQLRAVLDHATREDVRTPRALAYTRGASDAAARAFVLARVLAREPVNFPDFVVRPPPPKPEQNASQKRSKRDRGDSRSERSARGSDDGEQDHSKAKELFEPILALHTVRARILIGEIAPADAPAQLAAALTKLGASRRYQHHQYEWQQHDDEATRALLTIGVVPGIDGRAVFAAVQDALAPTGSLMRSGTLALLERASVVPAFRAQIVALAVASCDDARGIKIAADEKIKYLVELANLLLRTDALAARYCFDAAISIAGDVDYDTFHAISVTAPLATRARAVANVGAATRIAHALAAVVQDAAQRIGESDHFPWPDVAVALAALSPSTALAAAARFAELDLVDSPRLLAKILEEIAADGALDDAVLAAFLPLLGTEGQGLASALIERAAAARDSALAEEVARHLLREPAGDWRAAALAAGAVPAPRAWTRAFSVTAAFIDAQPTARSSQHDSWSPSDMLPAPRPFDPALLEATGIDGIASFLARVDAIVAAEAAAYPSRRDAANRILAHVPVHRIHAFMEILTAIPEGNEIAHDLTRILVERLERWRDHGAAARWARERLLDVVETRLPELARYIDYRADDLRRLLDLAGAADAEIATRLLAAIERHIEALSSHGVFRLVGLLARYLTAEESLGVLNRHASGMLARLEKADRALPGFDTLDGGKATAARLLYAELGHIELGHRWRAAHGLRTLARLRRDDMLDMVRARYVHETEPALGHPVAPFYFMAARLWFMLSVARTAWETPGAIARYVDWLFEQAERADFPHLLIRAAARQALEGLMAADPSAFDETARHRISATAVSPLAPAASSQHRSHVGFDRHGLLADQDLRFRFDSLDTLPYWYTPLLRCFANPDPAGFLKRAEAWIVDRLGVTGDISYHDEPRGNARFNRDGYNRSSHHHGAHPAIERYRTYLEWHAMFLAGGEVLPEWPLTPPDDHDSWDQLSSWLARQGPTLAPAWLADLREPKPLDPIAWGAPDERGWLKAPPADETRRALGLDTEDWIVISSNRSIRHGEISGWARSESSLVSRGTATALRLALATSKNSHQYRLAVNHDEDDDIESGEFVLKSLLVDQSRDTELDLHDPLRGEVTAPKQWPHPRVVASLELTRDPSGLPIWRNRDGDIVIEARAWSGPATTARDTSMDSANGEQLLIRRDALRRLLEEEELDLIINLTFTRWIGERRYGLKKDSSREREFDHLIILRNDGAIEACTRGLGRWA